MGSVEGPLSLTKARAAAKKWLAEIVMGKDPAKERRDRQAKDAATFARVVGSYLADKGDEWAPKTRMDITRYLSDARYAGPLLRMAVDSIGRKDIALRIDAIKRERESPTAAANWRSSVSGFYAWAIKRGIADQNPVIGTDKPKTSSRERVLSGEELVTIWNACAATDDYNRIIRLLTLTACRRDEIGSMCWSELDFDKGSFTIPPGRAKTKSSARTIPLLPAMREIIGSVPRIPGRDWVFGQRAEGFTIWSAAKRDLDARCGFEDWVLHDIRRSVATHMSEELAVLPHVVEVLLGHEFRKDVAGRYNRARYAGPIRDAYLLWHAHLRGLLAGERKVIALSTA
jgi:integrase